MVFGLCVLGSAQTGVWYLHPNPALWMPSVQPLSGMWNLAKWWLWMRTESAVTAADVVKHPNLCAFLNTFILPGQTLW